MYNKDRFFVLTCREGKFIFKKGVTILSHAKIVRDTIMGGLAAGERINPTTAQRWIKEHLVGPAKDTEFQWVRA